MQVKVIKLITSEEIVAEVEHEAPDTLTLKNALALVMQQDRNGNIGVGVIPWGTNSIGSITIDKLHILYVNDPKEELVQMYKTAFSGIAVPNKQLIV